MSMQWYIIHITGLREEGQGEPGKPCGRVHSAGQDRPRAVPMEDVVEVRGGKKVVSFAHVVSGYVLVK